MNDFNVLYSTSIPESSSDHDVPLALFAYQENSGISLIDPDNVFDEISEYIARMNFTAKPEEIIKTWSSTLKRTVYVVGLGKTYPVTPPNNSDVNGDIDDFVTTLRHASGAFARGLKDIHNAAVFFPGLDTKQVQSLAEGLGLGNYRYQTYRSKDVTTAVEQFTLVSSLDESDAKPALQQASIIVNAVNEAKNLVNTPAADLYPENFAQNVSESLNDLPISVQVWDEKDLEAEGFGGLIGVGKGSARPPRLVKLSYTPKNASKHLALVGKGITFDTGGLSLKPANAMVGMKYDMTGAATVFTAIKAIAQMQLPVRVTAWLCLAENMPSSTATRPNDVLTIYGGQTVEVLNTDAEGRLVLADGLVAASQEQPDHIIDVATLTGAATIAVGDHFTPILGNDEFTHSVIASAAEAGEQFWQLPLDKKLRKILDSDIADIANAKPGKPSGGTIVGALFLADFIGTKSDTDQTPISWVHLDIAPTANSDSPSGYNGKGATGVAVRSLVQIAANLN